MLSNLIYSCENSFEKIKIALTQKLNLNIIDADKIFEKKKEIKKNYKVTKLIIEVLKNKKVIYPFQGIFDNKLNKITKHESLVRIQKDKEIISNFYFLDIAKKSNYYNEISYNVFLNSFKIAKKKNIEISINISALDLTNNKITKLIFTFFEKNPYVAEKITFEILEDENIKDSDKEIFELVKEI